MFQVTVCCGIYKIWYLPKRILAIGITFSCHAGPPNRNLGRYAARSMECHPEDAQSWVLTFKDGSTEVFVDPGDSVELIKDWLNKGVRSWFHLPESWGEEDLHPTRRRPAPLAVSGLVKVRHLASTEMHLLLDYSSKVFIVSNPWEGLYF